MSRAVRLPVRMARARPLRTAIVVPASRSSPSSWAISIEVSGESCRNISTAKGRPAMRPACRVKRWISIRSPAGMTAAVVTSSARPRSSSSDRRMTGRQRRGPSGSTAVFFTAVFSNSSFRRRAPRGPAAGPADPDRRSSRPAVSASRDADGGSPTGGGAVTFPTRPCRSTRFSRPAWYRCFRREFEIPIGSWSWLG